MNDVAIRPLQSRNVQPWATLRGALWPEADGADLLREANAFASGASESLVDAVFVAEDDALQTIGFVELSIRDFADGCDSMPIPHIEGWYVEPSARGQGVGTALMHAAEAWARERGFTEIASDTEVENVPSQRAHAALGYEETERLVKFRKSLTG
jgi:aminoglycoside 6'-N-acetyltransferase I